MLRRGLRNNAQKGCFWPGGSVLDDINARFRLDNRTALVTGAGRGIGRACAVALAQAGAEVWLAARTQGEVEQAAAEIRAAGHRAHAAVCDVTQPVQLKKLFSGIPVLDV